MWSAFLNFMWSALLNVTFRIYKHAICVTKKKKKKNNHSWYLGCFGLGEKINMRVYDMDENENHICTYTEITFSRFWRINFPEVLLKSLFESLQSYKARESGTFSRISKSLFTIEYEPPIRGTWLSIISWWIYLQPTGYLDFPQSRRWVHAVRILLCANVAKLYNKLS